MELLHTFFTIDYSYMYMLCYLWPAAFVCKTFCYVRKLWHCHFLYICHYTHYKPCLKCLVCHIWALMFFSTPDVEEVVLSPRRNVLPFSFAFILFTYTNKSLFRHQIHLSNGVWVWTEVYCKLYQDRNYVI